MLRTGVDLGGTKIEGVVLDVNGRVLARERRPTPGSSAEPASGESLDGLYNRTIEVIAAVISKVESVAGESSSIGLGHPGSFDGAGRLRNANTVALNGRELGRDLHSLLGRQVHMANDADCLALSEATDGAGSGHRVVFAGILGTGVGGGVVVDGSLVTGPSGTGGEWGHNPLPWRRHDDPELSCYCGKTACVETFVSGTGIRADHLRNTGVLMDGRSIVEQARGGDTSCLETLERYCDRLARSLASIINVLDPNVIVLGGGMSRVDEIYDMVPALWDLYVFGGTSRAELLPALHGDASGVRGAAQLTG